MLEPDQDARIVVVGIGTVGSAVVDELSRCGVTDFVLIDGDTLDTVNVIRHVLGPEDVGHNKAEAMAARLVSRYAAHAEFVPENLTETISDAAVDRVFAGADVIVAATDDRVAQRRVNRRALALDIPALFPGVDADAERGEVFVSLGLGHSACLECWDLFRAEDAGLREVAALNVDVYATVEATVRLCLGLLDPESEFADPFRGTRRDHRPRTIFLVSRFGARPRGVFADGRTSRRGVADYRIDCPGCGGQPQQETPVHDEPDSRRPATPAGAERRTRIQENDTDIATITVVSRWLAGVAILLLAIASFASTIVTWSLFALTLGTLAVTIGLHTLQRARANEPPAANRL